MFIEFDVNVTTELPLLPFDVISAALTNGTAAIVNTNDNKIETILIPFFLVFDQSFEHTTFLKEIFISYQTYGKFDTLANILLYTTQ